MLSCQLYTKKIPRHITNQNHETVSMYKDTELHGVYKILQQHLFRYVLEHIGNFVELEKVPTPVSLDDVWKTYHLPEPNVRLPKTASPLEHVAWSLSIQKYIYPHCNESLLFREEYLYYRLERIKETWLSYLKTRGLSASN
jgi:hypothetical protein